MARAKKSSMKEKKMYKTQIINRKTSHSFPKMTNLKYKRKKEKNEKKNKTTKKKILWVCAGRHIYYIYCCVAQMFIIHIVHALVLTWVYQPKEKRIQSTHCLRSVCALDVCSALDIGVLCLCVCVCGACFGPPEMPCSGTMRLVFIIFLYKSV